jgi:hypothetical protein
MKWNLPVCSEVNNRTRFSRCVGIRPQRISEWSTITILQQVKRGGYFGRIVGSPPGLPGGGITGVMPASGVGACISGSTPGGGHTTPSERASLSPSGSARRPVVVPSGTAVPERGAGCMGAQSPARSGDGGAVRAGGVVGPGGAWAPATSAAAIITHERNSARLKSIQ